MASDAARTPRVCSGSGFPTCWGHVFRSGRAGWGDHLRRLWFGLAILIVVASVFSLHWLGNLVSSKEVQQTLTQRISEATGFQVTLSGPIEFSWFPLPGLELSGLSLTNEKFDSAKPLVELGTLSLRLGLFESILKRQLMLGELTVEDAEVSLVRNRQGVGNWQTESSPEPASADSEGEGLDADSVVGRVQKFRVDGMTLRYRDEVSGRTWAFDSGKLSLVRPSSDAEGQVQLDGVFEKKPVTLGGEFSLDAVSPTDQEQRGLQVDLKGHYADNALKVDLKGFLGPLPDLSAVDADFKVSSDAPGQLAELFGASEWVKQAREVKGVSLGGQLSGDGPDGLSVRQGDIRLGMGDAFDLSVSGSLANVIDGKGLEAQLALKSQSPGTLLGRLGIDVPPVATASAQADLRGNLADPSLEDVKARVQFTSGMELAGSGSVAFGASGPRAELTLDLTAEKLETISESLRNTPGELGTQVSKTLSEVPQQPLLTHFLGVGPVDLSAQVTWAGGPWAVPSLKGDVGQKQGEWLRVSGQAKSVWPMQSGLQVRIDSRIENPPLGFSGREELLDHLDSIRVGLTWNMDGARVTSLEDLEIQVDVTGDLSLSVKGRVELKEDSLYGAKGTVSVKADSLAEFNGLVGRALPPWSPFSLAARFDGTTQAWKFDDLVLGLGRAKFFGEADLNQETAVPRLGLSLKVDQLSLPRASRAFRQEAPADSGDAKKTAPDADPQVDWSWLSSTEADISLRADRVVLGEAWPGQDMLLKLAWGGGVLRGPSLDVRWPQGGIEVRGKVDTQHEKTSLALGVAAHALDVKSIVGWMGQPQALSGSADLILDLSTEGTTQKAMMAGLNGSALLYVSHGSVLNEYANALQLGFDRGSGSGDQQPMNCLIAALESTRGVVSTNALLWDTPIKLVRGLGVLNLNTDHLDLLLRPHLKRTIARSVTAAIRIEGPLEDLRVRPEPLQTVTDLARGLIGRTLRIVDHVSPQLGRAVIGLGSTTGSMVASTGLDVPSVMDFLSSPETCESVLASKEVKRLEAFEPAKVIQD